MTSNRQPLAPPRFPRSWNCWKTVLVICVCICFSPVNQAAAVQGERRENAIKAAFLFHLAQFVSWPEETKPKPGEPLRIAVLEPNPFDDILERIVENQNVEGSPLKILYVTTVSAARDAEILFIPSQAADEALQEAVELVKTQPMLLVGETRDFIEHGGMVALVGENDQVRIVIGRDPLEKAGLIANARLLRLAETEERKNGR